MQRRDFLIGTAAGAIGVATPALAFERVGDRRMMVFSGGQPVPVLDPHVRYDWSTRMMQQAIYDALGKYEGQSAESRSLACRKLGDQRRRPDLDVPPCRQREIPQRRSRRRRGRALLLRARDEAEQGRGVDAEGPPARRRTFKPSIRARCSSSCSSLMARSCRSFRSGTSSIRSRSATGDDYGQKFLTDGDAGSGPFRIKRWDGQAVMALDAVDDYWKGWPMQAADRPAGVIYRVIREPAPRKAALQRGEIDMVTEMTPDDYDATGEDAGHRRYRRHRHDAVHHPDEHAKGRRPRISISARRWLMRSITMRCCRSRTTRRS